MLLDEHPFDDRRLYVRQKTGHTSKLDSPISASGDRANATALKSYTFCRADLEQKSFPVYRQPVEIGAFSVDINRRFLNSRDQLKYYVHPDSVNFNLSEGYREFIGKDETVKEYIDHLLSWLLANSEKLISKNQQLSTDFVCWRGLLTKILCTPYESQDGWIICVTKFQGTYYLCEFETKKRARDRENESERQKLMCYWGVKFEQFVTTDRADGGPDTSKPVNNIEAYCTVIHTKLNSHSLIFAGETDCIDSTSLSSKPSCYIELKTSRHIEHPRQLRNFRKYKLIKWWAQSFLPGLQKIVCGFRDDNGIVTELQTFRLSDIPKQVKELGSDAWRPTACMNFADNFLSFVKQVVVIDNPVSVYKFEWCPPEAEICVEFFAEKSSFSFLPDWYTEKAFTS